MHVFWVCVWMSWIGKPSICHERCCKNELSQKLHFSWFQGPYFMILGGLGINFHDFCCPGDCLEIWWLFRLILGSPQILSTCQVEGKLGGSRALVTKIPGSLKPSWFWVALRPIFMIFVVPETGLLDDSSGWFWGHSRFWVPARWKVFCSVPGP